MKKLIVVLICLFLFSCGGDRSNSAPTPFDFSGSWSGAWVETNFLINTSTSIPTMRSGSLYLAIDPIGNISGSIHNGPDAIYSSVSGSITYSGQMNINYTDADNIYTSFGYATIKNDHLIASFTEYRDSLWIGAVTFNLAKQP